MSLIAADPAAEADSVPPGWTGGVLASYIERPEYGYTDSASDDPTGTKFLRITDIQDGQVDWDTVPYCRCPPDIIADKRLLPGDVVVARIGATTGKSFYIDATPEEAVFASYLIRLRAKAGELLPRYLYYYMQSAEYWAHVALHKGDRLKGGVNIGVLESLPIVVPPKPDQARIVAALDWIEKSARLESDAIAGTERLKAAAMQQLFSRGLTDEAQKDTEIGPIPESWTVANLGSLGKVGNGTTPNRKNPAYWVGGTVPWITSGRMYERQISGSDEAVTERAISEANLPLLQPGAVLMAIVGQGKTLGHCALLEVEATVSRHVGYIQPNSSTVHSGYLRGFLESQYQHLRQLASGFGSTRGALTGATLRSLQVPLPLTIAEQHEIVEILDALDRKIELHRRKRDGLDQLLKSLLAKLMTGEVSVEHLDLTALPKAEGSAV